LVMRLQAGVPIGMGGSVGSRKQPVDLSAMLSASFAVGICKHNLAELTNLSPGNWRCKFYLLKRF